MAVLTFLRRITGFLLVVMALLAMINAVLEFFPDPFGKAEAGAVILFMSIVVIIGSGLMISEHKKRIGEVVTLPEEKISIEERIALNSNSIENFREISLWKNPSPTDLWLPMTFEPKETFWLSDMAAAVELFEKFKALPTINWKIVSKDCEARADYLIDYALSIGACSMGKTWASAEAFDVTKGVTEGFSEQLRVYLDVLGTEYFEWNYHVAPYTMIKEVGTIVFDPGLFDRPVDLETWKLRVQGDTQEVSIETSSSKMYNGPEDYCYEYCREPNLEKRSHALMSSFNIDNPSTWKALDKYLRADYVKLIKNNDELLYEKLNALLTEKTVHGTNLFHWFWYYTPPLTLIEELTPETKFYGKPLEQLYEKMLTQPLELRYHFLRKETWQTIDKTLEDLSQAYRKLPFNEMQEIDSEVWFRPWADKLWKQHGYTLV